MPFLRHPQPRARARAGVEAVPQAAEAAVEAAGAGERIAVRMRGTTPVAAAQMPC